MALQARRTRRGRLLLERWALGSHAAATTTAATTAATTTTAAAVAAASRPATSSRAAASLVAASPSATSGGGGSSCPRLIGPVSNRLSSRHRPGQGLRMHANSSATRLLSSVSGSANSAADLVEMMRRIVHRGGRGRKQDNVPQEVGVDV